MFLSFTGQTIANESVGLNINPNNLTICSGDHAAQKTDKEKTLSWNNCWGKIAFQTDKKKRGDIAEGEWKNGLLQGHVIYFYSNGDKYEGQFKNGIRHGEGFQLNTRGGYYSGSWNLDKQSGYAITVYENGDYYVGEYKNNDRHGKGTYTTLDGQETEGIWRLGKLSQPSAQKQSKKDKKNNFLAEEKLEFKVNPNKLPQCRSAKWRDEVLDKIRYHNCWGISLMGDGKYTGEFKDGVYHGYGYLQYFYGDKYVGTFESGKPSGQGTLISSIDKYVGEFKEGVPHGRGTYAFVTGDMYFGEYKESKMNGQGTYIFPDGDKYVGEFKDSKYHGLGIYVDPNIGTYFGQHSDGKKNGQGIVIFNDGKKIKGIFEKGEYIRESQIDLPDLEENLSGISDRYVIEEKFQKLLKEHRRIEEKRHQPGRAVAGKPISIQTSYSEPSVDGSFNINIRTNADTASLQIDGKEEGGKSDGIYTVKRVARAGQTSTFKILATDIFGNTDTKTITVNRPIAESQPKFAALNPSQIKKQPERDAVAIVIGIADYKNLPRADFANDDASMFYDYAIRGLGIKPENVKLLVDANADDVAIYQAFKTWLPSRVRSTTDVYVYYSGHGLPAEDGQGLYLLPQRAHRDLIEKTAISQRDINGFIQAAKPKSVTIFLDSCDSGLARTGETLLASARPVALKTDKKMFPDEFTVITASQADQISSSSPDLKHGIFSYYLMRGMEGEADANRDGKITVGEMHGYLAEQVARQAGMMNRRQEPQLVGDANRVLVGR